jgi:hypothetical protein
MISSLLSAIAALAVAVHPLLAVAMSCHCAKIERPQHACCEASAPEAPAVAAPDCHLRAEQPASSSGLRVGGCCCASELPSATLSVRSELPQLNFDQPAMLPVSLSEPFASATVAGYAELGHQGLTLHGPPLLALFCRWLN